MPGGGQKNTNLFEKPNQTSLKVKVKKIAGKNKRKTRQRSRLKTKAKVKKENTRAPKKQLKANESGYKRNNLPELEGRILEEKIRRSKELIMWSGVGFFMLLIAFFWIYNLNHTFKKLQAENSGGADAGDWRQIAAELEEKIGEFKDSYEEIKSFNEQDGAESGLPAGKEAGSGGLFSASSTDAGMAAATGTEAVEGEIEELIKILEEKQ